MGYKQLDYKRRCQIFGLWKAGYAQSQIAKEIGANQSTISRELNRNITFIKTKFGCWQYKPEYAQGYSCYKYCGTIFKENYLKESVNENSAYCFDFNN